MFWCGFTGHKVCDDVNNTAQTYTDSFVGTLWAMFQEEAKLFQIEAHLFAQQCDTKEDLHKRWFKENYVKWLTYLTLTWIKLAHSQERGLHKQTEIYQQRWNFILNMVQPVSYEKIQ